MKEVYQYNMKPILPLKSVAGALLFSVFLGPIGLLYASVMGGILLIILSFIAMSGKFFVATSIFWVAASVWSVIAVNRYNQKVLKKFSEG